MESASVVQLSDVLQRIRERRTVVDAIAARASQSLKIRWQYDPHAKTLELWVPNETKTALRPWGDIKCRTWHECWVVLRHVFPCGLYTEAEKRAVIPEVEALLRDVASFGGYFADVP